MGDYDRQNVEVNHQRCLLQCFTSADNLMTIIIIGHKRYSFALKL